MRNLSWKGMKRAAFKVLLEEAKSSECAENCEGRCLRCAKAVLSSNGIALRQFASAIRTLLVKGMGEISKRAND